MPIVGTSLATKVGGCIQRRILQEQSYKSEMFDLKKKRILEKKNDVNKRKLKLKYMIKFFEESFYKNCEIMQIFEQMKREWIYTNRYNKEILSAEIMLANSLIEHNIIHSTEELESMNEWKSYKQLLDKYIRDM